MKTWKQMIESLVAAGLIQTEIAAKTGLSPQTISDLLAERQKSLKYEPGLKLVQLHDALGRKRKTPKE